MTRDAIRQFKSHRDIKREITLNYPAASPTNSIAGSEGLRWFQSALKTPKKLVVISDQRYSLLPDGFLQSTLLRLACLADIGLSSGLFGCGLLQLAHLLI